jgi:hypothetical protein
MSYRRLSLGASVVTFLAVVLLAASPRPLSSEPTVNKVPVRQLDLGYRLEDGGFKIRATLATGLGVEYETRDAATIDALLRIAELHASERTQVFAEILSDGRFRSLDVTVR